MNFISRFAQAWNAATLTPPPLPKAPNAPQAIPSHRTQVAPAATVLRRPSRDPVNTSRTSVRTGQTAYDVIRELAELSPDLGAATFAMLRTGIPEKYRVVAYNLDNQIDPSGTALAHELLNRVTFLGAADGSYGAQLTLNSLSEQLGKELIYYGACALEVALDKARIPASFNPVSVTKLKAYDEDNAVRWVQVIGGEEVDLDIPTFIYTSVDQLLTEPYSSSILQTAVQPTLADLEFNDDVRRVLKRAVHPRLAATISSEIAKKQCPPDVLNDQEKYTAYLNNLIAQVQDVLNGLAPEDALVSFDTVSHEYVDGGHDPSTIIERIQKVLNGKLAAGSKTLPVVLGQGGSSNSSSAESMLYIKTADMLRRKLNEVYSRALTVALRLMGVDGFVKFTYDEIDLRPASELAAFRAMETSNTLQLLSLGFLTDEQASIELTRHLPPAGFKPLSGTGFYSSNAAGSQINTDQGASNTSAMGKALKPGTPSQPKS